MAKQMLWTAVALLGACGGVGSQPQGSSSDASLSGGAFAIVNRTSKKCLDDVDGSASDGNAIVQSTCDGQSEQGWTAQPNADGTYSFVNRSSGLCLDVTDHSVAVGAKLQQWSCTGEAQQSFVLEPTGQGRYTIIGKQSGLCLDIPGASTSDGARLQQYTCNGTGAQAFKLTPMAVQPSADLGAVPPSADLGATDLAQSAVDAAMPVVVASGSREPWDQPFASTSVWNLPIGSNATWSDPATDPGTAHLNRVNGVINAGNYGQPVYTAGANDPLITVTLTDTIESYPPQQVHSPASAIPAPPTPGDHHMAFFDQTQPTKMYSYASCNFDNGNDVTAGVTCALGGVWDACGDGVDDTTYPLSRYNFAIGAIRHWELAAGKIDHTLRYSTSNDLARSPGPTWTSNIPWPDKDEDYNGPTCGASDGNGYCGDLDAGLTIGIPANVDLGSLGLSQGGLMLATALQQHGAIWRDSGGSNQVTFYAEPQDDNDPMIQQMRGDMGTIVPQLRVLTNQGPTNINGGGTPIVPAPAQLDTSICPN